ncbi:MAG: phosphatidylserine/phosphatidylglycerophosphate/cardiolipin synthase family protein [Oligoflexia bacterium]|nr:phosphatidylserine/phosphatidylglycerophosphate/cardiolipin synthase family protein [Oligoflexia bacterium]
MHTLFYFNNTIFLLLTLSISITFCLSTSAGVGFSKEEKIVDGKALSEIEQKRERELQIEKSLTRVKTFEFDRRGIIKTTLIKKIEVKNCIVSAEIRHETLGPIIRNVSDLSNKNDNPRKVFKFKRGFGIGFGPLIDNKLQPTIYFPSFSERNKAFAQLTELRKLCKRDDLKELISILNKEELLKSKTITPAINQQCLIPEGYGETSGTIHMSDKENKIALISNGATAYHERYKAIMAAKKSIYVQALIFSADAAGEKTADYLIQKKKEGVDVKVIFDALSVIDVLKGPEFIKRSQKIYDRMLAAGIPVLGYSTQGLKGFIKNETRGFEDIDYIQERYHDKMLVIDGDDPTSETSIAFVGGMNVANEYLGLSQDGTNYWRDQDVSIKGPLIKDIQESFKRNLIELSIGQKTYKKEQESLNPFDPIKEKKEYEEFFEDNDPDLPKFSKKALIKENERALQKTETLEKGIITILPYGVKKIDLEVPTLDFKKVDASRWIPSRPKMQETYIIDAYLDLINNAKEEILIANAYFIPSTKEFQDALKAAAKRGVKIKILCNDDKTNDSKMVTYIGRTYYKGLIEDEIKEKMKDAKGGKGNNYIPTNIEIYEWTGIAKDDKTKEIVRGTMHGKYMVVDRKVSLVGSHNLDPRSGLSSNRNKTEDNKKVKEKFYPGLNSETAVVFQNEELAKKMAEDYIQEINAFAHKVSYSEMDYYAKPTGKKLGIVRGKGEGKFNIANKFRSLFYKLKVKPYQNPLVESML